MDAGGWPPDDWGHDDGWGHDDVFGPAGGDGDPGGHDVFDDGRGGGFAAHDPGDAPLSPTGGWGELGWGGAGAHDGGGGLWGDGVDHGGAGADPHGWGDGGDHPGGGWGDGDGGDGALSVVDAGHPHNDGVPFDADTHGDAALLSDDDGGDAVVLSSPGAALPFGVDLDLVDAHTPAGAGDDPAGWWAHVFPPPLDVVVRPADGGPWVDVADLGVPGDGVPWVAGGGEVAPLADVVDYAGHEPGVGWEQLAGDDDPAVNALARWWRGDAVT